MNDEVRPGVRIVRREGQPEQAHGEERPEPELRFSEELDRWAAAGFPRGAQRPGAPTDSRPGLLQRLSLPRARTLATAGAVCTVLVVIGIGVSQLETPGGDTDMSASGGEMTQRW